MGTPGEHGLGPPNTCTRKASTCLIHLRRCTGCLAYVAAKPESAPETVVSYHFAFALLGAGGELPAELPAAAMAPPRRFAGDAGRLVAPSWQTARAARLYVV